MRKQKTYRDSWTVPYVRKNGQVLHGGAARSARIADQGGMDVILKEAALVGATMALQHFAAQLGISVTGVNSPLTPRAIP